MSLDTDALTAASFPADASADVQGWGEDEFVSGPWS